MVARLRPARPVRATLFHRTPGLVVGAAMIHRGQFLATGGAPDLPDLSRGHLWAVVFTVGGVFVLAWNLAAPWRTSFRVPWAAVVAFAIYGGFGLEAIAGYGFRNGRALGLDHIAIAVMVAFHWAGKERLRTPAPRRSPSHD